MARGSAAVRSLPRTTPKTPARAESRNQLTGLTEIELDTIWRTYKKTRDEVYRKRFRL